MRRKTRTEIALISNRNYRPRLHAGSNERKRGGSKMTKADKEIVVSMIRKELHEIGYIYGQVVCECGRTWDPHYRDTITSRIQGWDLCTCGKLPVFKEIE